MKPTLSIVLSACVLAGCSRQQAEAPATAPPATPAQSAGATVDAPLAMADVGLGYAIAQPPAYQASTDTIVLAVRVTNQGKATIASAGRYPVRLGLVLLPADATTATPPLRQDFVRVDLPESLSPGKSIDVPMHFPVTPAVGARVVVDAVQERVHWFRGYGKPVLDVGVFQRCNGQPGTACTGEGTPLPVAH